MMKEEIEMSLDKESKHRCTVCITNTKDSVGRRVGYVILTDKQEEHNVNK